MVQEARPTNDRIVALLETISRQLDELRDAQKQMAADLEKVGRTSS